MIQLSKRLMACAQYTRGFSFLADIGTDHASLPIYCIKQGYVLHALAIDNKEGPFVIAYSSVLKNELQNRITVKKSDGIKDITDETDVVVISGLGGKLIKDILLNDSLRNVKRLILQPNIDAFEVRAVAMEIGFYIVDEIVLEDSKKYYEIIVMERGQKEYSALELEFGPINLQIKPYYFMEKYKKELAQYQKLVTSVPKEHIKDIQKRILQLEEVLV